MSQELLRHAESKSCMPSMCYSIGKALFRTATNVTNVEDKYVLW